MENKATTGRHFKGKESLWKNGEHMDWKSLPLLTHPSSRSTPLTVSVKGATVDLGGSVSSTVAQSVVRQKAPVICVSDRVPFGYGLLIKFPEDLLWTYCGLGLGLI